MEYMSGYATINDIINTLTKEYIDERLKEQAERTYDVISSLIEWNIKKEEFVKLLME